MVKVLISLFILIFSCISANAQFWFGPKGGIRYIQQVYQDDTYEDFYKPKNVISWQAGGVANYTITEQMSIHTELLYERVGRRVKNKPDTSLLDSKFTYNFLTTPVLFRFQFGRSPIRYYINAGPQFRYWLSAKGSIFADELVETSGENLKVKVIFKDPGASTEPNTYYLPHSNRLQYAFILGGGISLDLFNLPHRLMIDGRYAFGHSIMGFNRGTEPSQLVTYGENFEFRDNSISISLAYLFGFNPIDARKGSSTVNKKKLK